MNKVSVLQKLVMAIDRRYLKKVNATTIPGSEHQLLLICFHPYEGKKLLTLADGVTINPGDLVGEFHLANQRVAEMGKENSSRSMEWRLFEILKAEFSGVAKACSAKEISSEVKGFYEVNVLAAGARRLGFTMVAIPKGWNRWWLGFWETLLRKIFYSFKTKKKATFKKTKDAFEIWITREELIKRYLRP
jgi:hypothetical protein